MMSTPPERGRRWRISITGWLWLDQWRDAEMLDLICPKEQPCDNVPATRPLSESTTQPVKQKRGGTYALTLLYVEQCHYVHKIGIALFRHEMPHSTVYAFIFFY